MSRQTEQDQFLTIDELAKRWKLTRRTLEKRHQHGRPMPSRMDDSGLKRYRLSDVRAFEDSLIDKKQ